MPLNDDQRSKLAERFGTKDPLAPVLDQAVRKDPDQSAEVIDLAERHQLPIDTVERNKDEVKSRDKFKQFDVDEIEANSPITADFLRRYQNAQVAIDDIDTLRGLEDRLKPPTPWWDVLKGAVSTGGQRFERGIAETIGQGQASGNYPIQNYMDEEQLARYKALKAQQTTTIAGRPGLPLDNDDAAFLENPLTPEQTVAREKDIAADEDIQALRKISGILGEGMEQSRPREAVTDPWSARGFVANALEGITGMAPALALGAMGPGLPLALSTISVDVFGNSLADGREKGLSESDNINRAAFNVMAEVIPESIPVMGMLGKLPGGALKNWLVATLGEGAQEMITEVLQTSIDKGIYDENASAAEVFRWLGSSEGWSEIAYAGLIGGAMGATLGAPRYAVDRAMEKRQQNETSDALQSIVEQTQLDEIITLFQDSSTRQRAQDKFKGFLRAVNSDGQIYIAAEDVRALTEAGVELPRYITEQAVGDGDVTIPTDRFATEVAPNEILMEVLRPHIRMTTEGKSFDELQREQFSSIDILMRKAAESAEMREEADRVYDDVKDQLVATGRQSEQTAKYSAAVIRAYVTRLAEDYDISVTEAYERLNFRIEGPSSPPVDVGATTLKQGNQNADGRRTGPVIVQRDDGSRTPSVRETDGRIELRHWSSRPAITQFDPARHGQGISGAESRRKANNPDTWVDRTYYGLGAGQEGGYVKEDRLGSNEYVTSVDADSLYDWVADPDGFKRAAREQAQGESAITLAERMVKEAGYQGYWVQHPSLGAVASVFNPLEVENEVTRSTGQTTGRNQRTVRGEEVVLEQPRRQNTTTNLTGLPTTFDISGRGKVEFGAFPTAREAAYSYAESAGVDYRPITSYAKLDKNRAKRIAEEFEKAVHDPTDPETIASYDAMVAETIAQYQTIMDTGLTVEFITGEDPYGYNPRLAILDIVENNHMWVYSTRDGYGSNEAFDPTGNPLLRETEFEISGQTALANDLFRVVHDYFGHAKDGVGFRAEGEENAWRSHASMYSPLARRAMTTETRGQNSWVNYGPYGDANRTASAADTVYADQKFALLPEWVSEEGLENNAEQRKLSKRVEMLEKLLECLNA